MTKWLASVQSLAEAEALTDCLPDILDMKQPAEGALGALPVAGVRKIVNWLAGRCLSSATTGDLPMQVDIIAPVLDAMAKTGVDYIKLGLFMQPGIHCCIGQLEEPVRKLSVPVIAVLFADQICDLTLITSIKKVGFSGIMIDTAKKDGKGLLQHWSLAQIRQFVAAVKEQKMLCGLAGSLRLNDIGLLKDLGADYLGFRAALCPEGQRTAPLEPKRAMQIQKRLGSCMS